MKRIISLIMLLLIISAGCMIASCGTDDPTKDAETNQIETQDTVTESNSTYPEPQLPNVSYPDQDFTVLVRKNGDYGCADIYADIDTGDTLKDSVYNRNAMIYEKYGITVKEISGTDDEIYDMLYNAIASNEKAYDLADITLLQTHSATVNGLLYDLNNIEYLDLSNPWWDQKLNDAFTINGRQYYAVGDSNVQTLIGTWVLAFNKKLIVDMGYDQNYIYDLIKEGKWTFEKYYELVKGFTRDLNNDNKMDMNDQYGLAGNGSSTIGFMNSAGVIITQQDEEGMLAFNEFNQKTSNLLTEIGKILDPDYVYNSEKFFNDATYGAYHGGVQLFRENRALFTSECFNSIEGLRDMEADFGLAVHPKYSENDEYTSWIHHAHATAMAIPINVSDIEKTAIITEYMSWLGTDNILPVYYERVLAGKNTRDSESYDIIVDYIMPNRKYDLGFANNFAGLMLSLNSHLMNGTNGFASAYRSVTRSIASEIETVNDAYLNLEY